jgi:DNA-binding Lrp family transcriptional regulator
LVKSDNADQTASALTADLKEGGDAYIIIRADKVQWEAESFARDVNLIVPVDAASANDLERVLSKIRAMPGVRELTVANVTAYYPDPPHKSHTFVTADELGRDRVPEYDPPGRHPKSPGRNGWG